MIIFVSKTRDTLNGKILPIDEMSDFICLSPYYKQVTLKNENVKILLDSGAFQDTKKDSRLSFEEALERQFKFESKLNRKCDYIVAYDLIDCIETTINANKFLLNQSLDNRKKVIMTQGNGLEDYIFCLEENINLLNDSCILGLGGISKAANNNKLKEKIFMSIKIINSHANVNHVHLFGVGSISFLKDVKSKLRKDIKFSCDSSTFEFQSVMGKELQLNGKWIKKYTKEDKYINYHPCDMAIKNITRAINLIEMI